MKLKLPKKPPYTLKAIADVNDKHLSTVCRWESRGIGGVRLETYRVGGRKYVDRQALEEFDRALNCSLPPATAALCTDSVDEELDAEGL